jgi:hypothetical protein
VNGFNALPMHFYLILFTVLNENNIHHSVAEQRINKGTDRIFVLLGKNY